MPSHCEGSRDPAMNNQIKGTHKAGDASGSLAGSNRNSNKSNTSQRSVARLGGIVAFYLLHGPGAAVDTAVGTIARGPDRRLTTADTSFRGDTSALGPLYKPRLPVCEQ